MLRSPMRILVLLALAILGPNLMWTARSSVHLLNATGQPVALRLVLDDDPPQAIDAGTIDPGAGRFLWIEPKGEATLSVEIEGDVAWQSYCAAYVEDAMYRVAVTVTPEGATCVSELPLLRRLLVADVLR